MNPKTETAAEKTAVYLSPALTPREREVVECFVAGATVNTEISHKLKISVRTVELHRAGIMEKYGARNAFELARKIFERRG